MTSAFGSSSSAVSVPASWATGSSRAPSQTSPSGEAEIRSALRAYVQAVHGEHPDTVVLEELGLRSSYARADLAVVNGALHGYEIKSDRDTFRRLSRQVPVYNDIFDTVTLVVGQRLGTKIVHKVPDWWEILDVVEQGPALQLLRRRPGRPNPKRSARALVELLWHDSALALLEAHGGARGFRKRPRCEVWDRLCQVCTVDQIATAVRTALKATPARGSVPQCG